VGCIRYEAKPCHVFLFLYFMLFFYVYNEGSKDIFVSSCIQRCITSDRDVGTKASWRCIGSGRVQGCGGRTSRG
jgi:hypothetical protein